MTELIMHRLTGTLENLLGVAADFLPKVLAMLIVVALGWVIALAVKAALKRILTMLKFDAFSADSGVSQTLRKTGLPSPSELLARIAFWVIWVCFMVLGLGVLGIVEFQQEIASFFQFVPHIFIALLILFIGILAANFFSRAALLAAVNADLPTPRLLSGSVRLLILILTVTMALEQIGLARNTVLLAFSITFGAVMLGLAIAFGLGGQHAARRLLEKYTVEREREKEEDISPL